MSADVTHWQSCGRPERHMGEHWWSCSVIRQCCRAKPSFCFSEPCGNSEIFLLRCTLKIDPQQEKGGLSKVSSDSLLQPVNVRPRLSPDDELPNSLTISYIQSQKASNLFSLTQKANSRALLTQPCSVLTEALLALTTCIYTFISSS